MRPLARARAAPDDAWIAGRRGQDWRRPAMQLAGLLYGSKPLRFVEFPCPEVLGPEATKAEIKAMIDRHGMIFLKPIFKGGIGKKGKAGLRGRNMDTRTPASECRFVC
jgi:hypothetical protein